MHKALLVILVAMFSGCNPEPGNPEDIYLAYMARSAQGMSFDNELGFWSKQKIAQLEEKIESLMERSGKNRQEAIDFYMDFSKRIAECTALELVSKEVIQSTANIVFAATGTCGEVTDSRHKVRLVFEREWKLDDVEMAF